jgi:hypothetical protein
VLAYVAQLVGLCRDTFVAEGASEAEIEEELAVVKTQLAFVKQMRGDLDGALADYRNVLRLKYVRCPSGPVSFFLLADCCLGC